jgi:lipopolysaccharide transport system permease protein
MNANAALPGARSLLRGAFDPALQYRALTLEMTRRELREKFAGHTLGWFWSIGHPVLLMATYVFLFAFVFPARLSEAAGSGDFVVFILSGVIPWLCFADAIGRTTSVLLNNAHLVKHQVFPLAVLPAKTVLAAFFAQLVSTLVLALVMLIVGKRPGPLIVALPYLFLVEIVFLLGLGYLLAAVTVFVRDLREMVQVLLGLGLFLTPALYVPGSIESRWPAFFAALSLNPISHFIWCFQDAVYYGQMQHPISWIVAPLMSILALLAGHYVFRRAKPGFGDVL